MVTYVEEILSINSFNTDHVVFQSHVTNKSHYISTIRVPMTTKLDRMISYLDGLLHIK